MFVRVEITTPGQVVRKSKVDGPQITLGRDPACQIPFDGQTSSAVSWQHARVEFAAGGASVTDLGSSNGTFVNGAQVSGKKAIQQGDVIGLGQTGPKVRIVELSSASPPPVHATVAEKLLPHGLLTPPAGNKPLNVSIDTPAPRPTPRRRRSPLGGIVLGLLAIGAVAAAGAIVFKSQQKTDEKKDDSAEKPNDVQAKADPAPDKKDASKDTPKDAGDPKATDAGKKDPGNSKIPEPPPPVKLEKDPVVPPTPPTLLTPMTESEIYRKTLQSTGWVTIPKTLNRMVTGTGSLVDREQRLFLTAYHVVEGATEAKIYFPRDDADGRPISVRSHYLDKERPVIGEVIHTDSKRDLAVLRLGSVPASVAVLPLAAKGVETAHRIFTVGNPGVNTALWVYTPGSVSQVAFKKIRLDNKQDVEAWMVEAQFPINPGDSGGPVVNSNVELVGVNCSFNPAARLLSNCIDLREIRVVLEQARRNPNPLGTNP